MSYQKITIRKVIEMIGCNEIYLPAIQRKFVWKHNQIELLFDSIMRDFPIGTFLFWSLSGNRINDYTFYKFLTYYNEKNHFLNEIAPKPELKEKIIGILDGQQRLSSMYIALQGTYAYKLKYYPRNSPNAYPPRRFYLNLFNVKNATDSGDISYEFKFLPEKDANKCDENSLWFEVKNVLEWEKASEVNKYYRNILNKHKDTESRDLIFSEQDNIDDILTDLWEKLTKAEIINYYNITEDELDNILDIFVRVNSAGTVLSKSDLLFSTIIAHWEEGREEIENLLLDINDKGDGFNFDTDFVMRSCLVLTDCPVLFKVGNFKQENIVRIKNEWENIKLAIATMVDILVEFGFSGSTLTSQYAVIPIAYYLIKGGQNNEKTRKEFNSFLIYSLIKQVYGSQGDRVLAAVRERMREKTDNGDYGLKSKEFIFADYINLQLPNNRTFTIDSSDLDEIFEYRKGAYTFMILTLLYPNFKFDQIKFHQDHIHPDAMFKKSRLKHYGIEEERWATFQELKDRLPNLQLMEGRENEVKNKTPFIEWIEKADIQDKNKYMTDNHIPKDVNLEFNNFEEFYLHREKLLREKLDIILHPIN